MASNSELSFADWRCSTNDNLMTTAENLLEKLEDVADMLLEIDDMYMQDNNNGSDKPSAQKESEADQHTPTDGGLPTIPERPAMVQRFHEGVESARCIIGVLKKEKWRLSRREMSVEMRMGELEEYKSHLQSDMSSMNQTVDVLSMRVVQLENQLVEAQEAHEQQEAEIVELKQRVEDYKTKVAECHQKNVKLKKTLEVLETQTPHTLITENTMVKNEIAMLMDENVKLKELIRNMDSASPASSDEHLTRLTRDFLRQLSSLDDDQQTSIEVSHTEPEVFHISTQESSDVNTSDQNKLSAIT